MTLNEMNNQINALGAQIRATATELAQMASNPAIPMEDVNGRNEMLQGMNRRMSALQAAYQSQYDEEARGLPGPQMGQLPPAMSEAAQSARLHDMRRSNEYANAFAYAMRTGLTAASGRENSRLKVLFDALTEKGGTPDGSDGGFLVPLDMDNMIRERIRDLQPLADLFGRETVTSGVGWRVVDTAPTKGMTPVDEMGEIPTDDQPKFSKVDFALKKYGLILPVSNELMADNDAGLMAYLAGWMARKYVLTQNALLMAAMKTLPATALGADPLAGIKTALNRALDPAISVNAFLLMNQAVFDHLDQQEDSQGRPLLQPNPMDHTQMRISGRPVKVVSTAQLAENEIFIGDGTQYASLFEYDGFEMASTTIGGNAFRTGSTEVRGIVRLDCRVFDADAMVRRSITIP